MLTPRHFAWRAWHLATSTVTLRGKCVPWRHPPSLCVAGVALHDIHLPFAWQAWHFRHCAGSGDALGRRVGAVGRAVTPRHFAWQAWHLATSLFTLRGRRGTSRYPPSLCVAGAALTALGWLRWRAWAPRGDAAPLCVAGVTLGDIHLHFAWQAWHLATSTFTLRGRRGTSRHPPSFCVAGVALHDIHLRFAWQAWHLWHWLRQRLVHKSLADFPCANKLSDCIIDYHD